MGIPYMCPIHTDNNTTWSSNEKNNTDFRETRAVSICVIVSSNEMISVYGTGLINGQGREVC